MCHNLAKIGVQGNAGPYFFCAVLTQPSPSPAYCILIFKADIWGQTVLVLRASYQQRSANVVIVFHMNTNTKY